MVLIKKLWVRFVIFGVLNKALPGFFVFFFSQAGLETAHDVEPVIFVLLIQANWCVFIIRPSHFFLSVYCEYQEHA